MCIRDRSYDRAEAFYGIRLRLPADAAMREAAHSMLAMWQAAHNADYYITKYGTKALEQLQNLIGQFALGLRRLELEEQQERDAGDAAVLADPQEYKRRARRVTLRLRKERRGRHVARWHCLFAQKLMCAKRIALGISTLVVWRTWLIHVCVC